MGSLAMLLKSYGADFEYAARLVESFNRFNVDGLPLYVVVPPGDVEQFGNLASANVTVLSEAALDAHLVTQPIGGMRPGYINQEIVKLSFWELGLADNYFCVDSDAVFIRPFGRSDFMRDEHTPYSVLVEDNELKVEPRYYREHWQGREQSLRRIQSIIGLEDPIIRTCHGHTVFSATVLRSFRDDFLAPRGWDYADALNEAPYEFTWYNMWLQHSRVIPIHAREPLVKVFHHEGQHLEYILRGITVDDIARGYVALVINSNYSRDLGLIRPDAPKPEALAPYLSYGEVGQLISAKAKDTFRRRFRG
ncbi:MAG: DUF6492 family protein [Actinobacteria bacterium]|nr:DUF6492 family protein [Actinomycetota bacterium]